MDGMPPKVTKFGEAESGSEQHCQPVLVGSLRSLVDRGVRPTLVPLIFIWQSLWRQNLAALPHPASLLGQHLDSLITTALFPTS